MLVILSALIKMFILALMFKTLNNEESLRKSVTLFDYVFKLDGINEDNPFIHAIKEAINPTIPEPQLQVENSSLNQPV